MESGHGREAGSVKQSIFIHLYLLSGKRIPWLKIKLYIFPHSVLCLSLSNFYVAEWRPDTRCPQGAVLPGSGHGHQDPVVPTAHVSLPSILPVFSRSGALMALGTQAAGGL